MSEYKVDFKPGKTYGFIGDPSTIGHIMAESNARIKEVHDHTVTWELRSGESPLIVSSCDVRSARLAVNQDRYDVVYGVDCHIGSQGHIQSCAKPDGLCILINHKTHRLWNAVKGEELKNV